MLDDTSTVVGRLATALHEQAAELPPGTRLPSTRELVAEHSVSPVTVSRALAQLAAAGVVTTRPGAGTYVARPREPAAANTAGEAVPDYSWQTLVLGDRTVDATSVDYLLQRDVPDAISLANGYPHPSLLPGRALAAALARAARRPDAGERPPPAGLAPLRSWFAQSLEVPGIGADDVLITGGAQPAISAAMRAILPSGAPVLVESPTYIGVLAAARAARLRAIPVPIDAAGIQPERLAAAFASTGSKLLFCQPAYQNPTGAVLSPERRAQVLELARANGAFVIEDDYARRLAHRGSVPPPPLLADDPDGRVIHIASLTKVASPNLRVGALVARGPVAERLRALRLVDDFFVSRMLQEATLELVSAPAWPSHLRRLSAALTARRDALLAEVATHLPEARAGTVEPPAGGLHLWIRLDGVGDDVALAAAARRAGVLVSPGRPYFAAEPPAAHVRLTFAGVRDGAELRDGVARLAGAVRESLGS